MPSTKDSRQPYRLSNFDLVTESLTLIAGNGKRPSCSIWYRRCTPVVVSSVTPLILACTLEYQPGWDARRCLMAANSTSSSRQVGLSRIRSEERRVGKEGRDRGWGCE